MRTTAGQRDSPRTHATEDQRRGFVVGRAHGASFTLRPASLEPARCAAQGTLGSVSRGRAFLSGRRFTSHGGSLLHTAPRMMRAAFDCKLSRARGIVNGSFQKCAQLSHFATVAATMSNLHAAGATCATIWRASAGSKNVMKCTKIERFRAAPKMIYCQIIQQNCGFVDGTPFAILSDVL